MSDRWFTRRSDSTDAAGSSRAAWPLALLVLLGLAIATAWLHSRSLLTLDALRLLEQGFALEYRRMPVLVTLAFFALFVAVSALSLPGASLLMLAGGASFGLVGGTALCVLASTTGATLSFLASRHLLRERLMPRLGPRLADLQRGFERDGDGYLFALRMVPVIPFPLLNLLMGLTAMPTARYFATSLLGMLAGTAVYVNAGVQLARVESMQQIFSPGLLAALALLGVLPLAARLGLRAWTAR